MPRYSQVETYGVMDQATTSPHQGSTDNFQDKLSVTRNRIGDFTQRPVTQGLTAALS